jgi:hypothetical protein
MIPRMFNINNYGRNLETSLYAMDFSSNAVENAVYLLDKSSDSRINVQQSSESSTMNLAIVADK